MTKSMPYSASRSTSVQMTLTDFCNDFALGSVIGKVWELVYTKGEDTGICQGPWIPIYGFGLALIRLILRKARGNQFQKILLAWLSIVALEYEVGIWSEKVLGYTLWNYDKSGKTNQPICSRSVLLELLAVITVFAFEEHLRISVDLKPLAGFIAGDLLASSLMGAASGRSTAYIRSIE